MEYAPIGGWAAFTRNEALTDALWDRLPTDDWVYLNLAASSSTWESREDGSIVSIRYDGERVVNFAAQAGVAEAFAKPLAVEFGLVASAESRPN